MLMQVEVHDSVIHDLKSQGLEIVHVGPGKAGDIIVTDSGKAYTLQSDYPKAGMLIVRHIPPIPDGVFWLEGKLNIDGIQTSRSFIAANWKVLHRDEFDYDKWMPRCDEFPVYVVPPKQVPLGPEDIVPGTTVWHPAWPSWYSQQITPHVNGSGVYRMVPCDGDVAAHYESFETLRNSYRYKTPTMPEFAPCSKPA